MNMNGDLKLPTIVIVAVEDEPHGEADTLSSSVAATAISKMSREVISPTSVPYFVLHFHANAIC